MGGSILYPLLVIALFVGLSQVEASRAKYAAPNAKVMTYTNEGQQFVAYRNAVVAYLQSNPTYIGTVSQSSLTALGAQFSTSFLARAGNYISQVGAGSGRVITCYASLVPGAVAAALSATDNDASFGIAQSNTWTSYAQGAVTSAQALPVAVPDGYVVSVIQVGG